VLAGDETIRKELAIKVEDINLLKQVGTRDCVTRILSDGQGVM
jgi:hypothetical protein